MNKNKIQILWGTLLVMAGLGVFYRIPQVMPKIMSIEAFANAGGIIRFCFYVLGILLIYGGAKKIYDHFYSFPDN
ncbi:MAG: hypothetical protein HQK62_13330 [Desulfamplus sp.]|nr:hypothetical protein [Desulfamplus sp.]MBF0259791.1 hypothetical protein [Desulfamplus sp.]